MNPDRWSKVESIFQRAVEADDSRRAAVLEESCAGDEDLRREVESLLAQHKNAGDFIERPAFEAETSPAKFGLTKGTKIGDYEVQSLIGSGGMGQVYRAHDLTLDRDVAVKVLRALSLPDRDRLRRFEQEARAAAALNHPNIVSVFQMGTYAGAPYLVSELLEGLTLREHVQRGPLTIRKAVDYAIQIAHGLAAAHGKGIVHRDLKPENLFVTKDGQVKILDFGLAKLTRPKIEATDQTRRMAKHVTDSGTVVGTAGYMPPEQVRGETADHRADIFAFGAILYEMVSGKRAFTGPTAVETMDAILNEEPLTLSRLIPAISPQLERVVNRCLEKNPEQRFHSASDLGFALQSTADIRSERAHQDPLLQEQASAIIGPSKSKSPRSKIVLLYRRNVQPDDYIAHLLETQLAKEECCVFLDRHLKVGVEWAREIESRIANADAVVALLSSASLQSEMMAYEIELAHKYAQRQGGRPRLLPVRVNLDGNLPDPINGILDERQYATWKSCKDDSSIVSEIVASLRTPFRKFMRPVKLEPVGGALPLTSQFYIVRPSDQEFHSAISRKDSIVLLKGARQMGKTSLMGRGLNEARKVSSQVVITDFQKLSSGDLQSSETLWLRLAEALTQQLRLDIEPRESWNSRKGPSTNFERFLASAVLPGIPTHLVWAMDEVDRLFTCKFASEVFGLLRSWHNERCLDPEGAWQKLTLCIAYATEAHLFITDMNQSPFNVGTQLSLADFTVEEVRELNQRYGAPLKSSDELYQLFDLLSGQPYLTQRGLYELASRQLDIESFAASAAKDEGPYGDHLRRILMCISQDAVLSDLVRAVLTGRSCSSIEGFYRLRSSGIMAGESARDMRPRCRLYSTYLKRHLL
jgi:serine/threonine protein kinase